MKKRFLWIVLLIVITVTVLYISTKYFNDDNVTETNKEDNNAETDMLDFTGPIIINPSENVYVEILPRLELLSGVLAQTSWDDVRGPKNGGNEYYRELKKFLSQYKEHEAIKIAQKLTNMGFVYDAPPAFILTLGELPKLNLDNEYSEYLIDRSKGKKILENFRLALIDLAEESNFLQFFEDNKELLAASIEGALKDVDLKEVIEWNKAFYGGEINDEFHLVFAPAMCFGGGYGATIEKPDGNKIIYQVIRENGSTTTTPYFSSGNDIGTLSLHEWGHSYVNPAVEKYDDDFSKYSLDELFKPVAEKMEKMAYGNITIFLNEQVLRACTIIAFEELYGQNTAKSYKSNYEKAGFYLTDFTIEVLKEYTSNRDKYPIFEDFIPYLFEQYHLNKDSLLKLVNKD